MAGAKDTACPDCGRKFRGIEGMQAHRVAVHERPVDSHETVFASDDETRPDWKGKCIVCGQSPVMPLTGMCGPCTFGESDTYGGNW